MVCKMMRRDSSSVQSLRWACLTVTLGSILLATAGQHPVEAIATERTARLIHGDIVTSRDVLTGGQSRRLGEVAPATWLLGLHPAQEADVHATLRTAEGRVLHPLPGTEHHHLVVHADEAAIRHVLTQHEDVTAAVLPSDMKVSSGVILEAQQLLQGGQGQQHMTLVVLIPRASRATLKALIQAAQQQLPVVLAQDGAECPLHVSQEGMFVEVETCAKVAAVCAMWAASQSEVTWVDVATPDRIANIYGNAIIQSAAKFHIVMDGGNVSPPPLDVLQGTSSGYFPLWQAGLNGTGQVAAVIDTGMDIDSCFFNDPSFVFNNQTVKTQILSDVSNQTLSATFDGHRKVVELIAYAGETDNAGHGTHTAGTIAGSWAGYNYTNKPLLGTGIAPGAKLVVVDGGPDNTDSELIKTPFDPAALYTHIREAGARVTSNSYGSSTYFYSARCVAWDQFAWESPDMLHVFSAGNEGLSDRHLRYLNGTVGAPAICKNVLSVGATESWVPAGWGWTKDQQRPVNLTRASQPLDASPYVSNYTLPPLISGSGPGFLAFEINTNSTLETSSEPVAPQRTQAVSSLLLNGSALEWYNQPGFLSQISAIRSKTLLVQMADPADGCRITQNYANAQLETVLLVRKSSADLAATTNDTDPTTCTPYEVALQAEKAGASAVLIYWDNATYEAAPPLVAFQFPAAVINKPGVGQQLASLLQAGDIVFMTFQQGDVATRPMDVLPFENVAEFSSFATQGSDPRLDTRIKPDIMAPGFLVSAYSNLQDDGVEDQCAVVMMAGTSMACPAAAGSAVLARQYFTEGWYPSGKPTLADRFTPSAALLKAVLIGGAAAMQGYSIVDGQRLAPPPNPIQGFGRVDLSTSLPLATTPNWKLQVVDNATLSNVTQFDYQFIVMPPPAGNSSAAPAYVTITWHDYPSYPGNTRVLVNDLDLTVTAPEGTVYWGNNITNGDRENNVERVVITSAAPGIYKVAVKPFYIYSGMNATQHFAMAVLGNISPGAPVSNSTSPASPPPGDATSPNATTPATMPKSGAAGTSASIYSIMVACIMAILASLF